jgi:tetratricopeptide (TPR) repeat protein
LQLLAQSGSPKLPPAARAFTAAELQELQQLAEMMAQRAAGRPVKVNELSEAQAKRAVNRLVKRGALLHTDIALLVPSVADRFRDGAAEAGLFLPGRTGILFQDGRLEGRSIGGAHWDVARLLIDQVVPAPSSDATARQWYQAVAMVFESRTLWSESVPHLERGRQIFSRDPSILAASGRVHEAFAAPRVQSFAQAASQPGHPATEVGSVRSNLRRAEDFFRRAVDIDGTFAEARVHLGRVVGLEGRHEEAATELRKATTLASDSLTRYYAWLFLGAEEQSLQHGDRARESFDSAAALFPRAQSPRLALSQLARRHGDRAGALRAIQRVLTLPADDGRHDDPWWTYLEDPAGKAESMMSEARALLFLLPEER